MISLKPNEVVNPRIENLLATQAFDSITESLSSDLFSAANSVFDKSRFKKSYSFSPTRVLLFLTKL